MERSSQLMTLAMCLYALSLIEYTPAFIPTAGSSAPAGSLRGTFGAGASASPEAAAVAATGLRTVAALVAVSAAAMSVRGSRAKAVARKYTNVPVTEAEWRKSDYFCSKPNDSAHLVYATALNAAAMKQKEAVPVAQDMMKIKSCLTNKNFMMENSYKMNAISKTKHVKFTVCGLDINMQDEMAQKYISVLGPFQSTVVPKFIEFLATKRRLEQLGVMAEEYVKDLYAAQDIAPVLVTSAVELSPEQKEAITEKMKKKTGASDIKLSCQIDKESTGGIKVYWEFADPDLMKDPKMIFDSSLDSYVAEQITAQGVLSSKGNPRLEGPDMGDYLSKTDLSDCRADYGLDIVGFDVEGYTKVLNPDIEKIGKEY